MGFPLEEIQRDVLLGLEIIEKRALGDAGLFGNLFGGGALQPFGLEQLQRGGEEFLLRPLFVLGAFTSWRLPAFLFWA
jgi:hypothetical protein